MGVFKRLINHKDGKSKAYWYIRYSIGKGKEKWESIGEVGSITKTVAQQKLEERKRQVRLGQLDMIGVEIPILRDFSKTYLTYVKEVIKKKSSRRDEISVAHLNSFFGNLKLSTITPKDVLDYQTKRLKDGMKPATVNRELACLKALLNVARQRGNFFGDNPVSKVKSLEENNQRERTLSLEEEEKLIANSTPQLIPIIIAAIHTGMRKGELRTLKWANVDLKNNIITIERANTKSKKLKRIPINSVLRKVLLEQNLKTRFNEYVFLNPYGKPYLKPYSLTTCFKNALKRSSITNFTFHDLRHTAGTRMIETGASLVAVSKVLGHSTPTITMRYAHPDNSLKEAVEGIANFAQDCSNFRSNENIE